MAACEQESFASFLDFPSPRKDLFPMEQTIVKVGLLGGPVCEVTLYWGALGGGNSSLSIMTAFLMGTFGFSLMTNSTKLSLFL